MAKPYPSVRDAPFNLPVKEQKSSKFMIIKNHQLDQDQDNHSKDWSTRVDPNINNLNYLWMDSTQPKKNIPISLANSPTSISTTPLKSISHSASTLSSLKPSSRWGKITWMIWLRRDRSILKWEILRRPTSKKTFRRWNSSETTLKVKLMWSLRILRTTRINLSRSWISIGIRWACFR